MSILDPPTCPECVTQHSEFGTVCLCQIVLLVSLHSHRYHHGSSDVPDDENRYIAVNEVFFFYQFLFSPGDSDTLCIGR